MGGSHGSHGKRKCLATGIYADRFSITIRHNGKDSPTRFPLGTSLSVLRQAKQDWARELATQMERAADATAPPDSLLADIPRYLATVESAKKKADDTARLQHWARTALAKKPRTEITKPEIKAQLVKFITEPQPRQPHSKGGPTPAPKPLAVQTANNCLTVLKSLYRELNTETDPNPTAEIHAMSRPEEDDPPRDIGLANAQAILAHLSDRGRAAKGDKRPAHSLIKVRLRLMIFTGWPAAVVMRLVPSEDIIWTPKVVVRVRARRKGKGVRERWLELIPEAELALREFVRVNAQGTFSTSSVYKGFQRAADKVRRDQNVENGRRLARGKAPLLILGACRPYDVRHTFITHMLRQTGGNYAGVQEIALHSTADQTLHYARAAVSQLGAAAIAAAVGSVPRPTLSPPDAATVAATVGGPKSPKLLNFASKTPRANRRPTRTI